MVYSGAVGIEQNILSALCIGAIIAAMGMVKNARIKALIFSLPISITTALIATGATVSAANVIGLFFLCLFLWVVYGLYKKGAPILLADAIGAAAYVAVGYMVTNFVQVPFYVACFMYILVWGSFTLWYLRQPLRREVSIKSTVHPAMKLTTVSTLAFVLLTLKNYLVGIVVTFPFAAVFAVVESRRGLYALAATFCQNSIAILVFFIAVYALQDLAIPLKLAFGWGVYALALWAVAQLPKRLQVLLPARADEDTVA